MSSFVWIMWDFVGSQILIPQSCLCLGLNSVIAPRVTVLCLLFAAVPDLKGPFALHSNLTNLMFTKCTAYVVCSWQAAWLIITWWLNYNYYGNFHHLYPHHNITLSLTVTWLNILVNVISYDHTAYYKGFCCRCHCTCRTWWFKEITQFDG